MLRLTDSGVALGVQSALLFLPVLLFGVLGGTFADRFDKRRILLWANVGYAVLAGLLFVLVATDVVQMWMVYSISALNGLLYAIEPPTRQSFYAELVGEQHITNAVSLNSAVFTGTRVLGGAIAGTMIQAFGLWSPFFLDAVSYVAVIGAPGDAVDELHLHRRAEREPAWPRGIQYVLGSPELRIPLLVMLAVYLFTFNFSACWSRSTRIGPSTVRAADRLAVRGARTGAFVGAIAMANRQPTPSLRRLGIFSIAFGATMAISGVVPVFWLAMVAMVPVGYASMLFAITANSTLHGSPAPTCADG